MEVSNWPANLRKATGDLQIENGREFARLQLTIQPENGIVWRWRGLIATASYSLLLARADK